MKRALACAAAAACLSAHAEVTVKDAWVRATVPQQRSTGAFMTIVSSAEAKLVGVASPAAKIAEIHETTQKDGVMSMRAMPAVALPAGKPVELKPGGLHVMLMALRAPVAAGGKVPLALSIEDARGKRSTLEVMAEVRPLGAR